MLPNDTILNYRVQNFIFRHFSLNFRRKHVFALRISNSFGYYVCFNVDFHCKNLVRDAFAFMITHFENTQSMSRIKLTDIF